MKVFVPSRDRACQLDLLIRSMEENLPNIEFDITVLYRYTNKLFKSGYDKLKEKQFKSKIKYLEEVDFQNDFWCFLKENENNLVMLLTDDCVFYRKSNLTEQDIVDQTQDDVWCWSARLGLNTTTQWYMIGEEQEGLDILGYDYQYLNQQQFNGGINIAKKEDGIIRWNWKIRPPFKNYGYMISWDGHVYKASDLLELVGKITFYNPRTFEDRLTKDPKFRISINKKYMSASMESILFVNTINAVQAEAPPAGSKYQISVEELNERYLSGEIVDMKSFDNLSLTGSHDEIPLLFKKAD